MTLPPTHSYRIPSILTLAENFISYHHSSTYQIHRRHLHDLMPIGRRRHHDHPRRDVHQLTGMKRMHHMMMMRVMVNALLRMMWMQVGIERAVDRRVRTCKWRVMSNSIR